MKKRTLMILLVLLCLAGTSFGQKKVAVYASDMANASAKMKTYGLILSRQLGVKVSQSSQYAAAVRTDEILAVVNKEHAYERGGSVDNNSIAEAGKQLGVDYVLVVTLIDMGDEVSLYVDWQLVNVVTAIADDADGTTYEIHNMAADLQKLADQLAERITGGSAKVKSFVGSTSSNKVCRMCADNMRDLEVASEDAPRSANWEQAKQYCSGLGSGWYLPSKDELNQLYQHKTEIGGFSAEFYWSSTESSSNNAWAQYFYNGNQVSSHKSYANRVRCVRRVN